MVFRMERIQTGIPGLDKLVEGGFVQGSNILVRGNTGTGKTLFCLQYLYHGATHYQEPGVFLSFSESKEAIYTHGQLLGWDFQKLEDANQFYLIRYSPHEVEQIVREGGGTIRDTIEQVKAKRLVVDSLTAYSLLFESIYQADESVLNLFAMLRQWGCTTLLTSEAPTAPDNNGLERLGFLTDGIINLYHLRHKQRRCRGLEIIKMRDTNPSDRISGLSIDKKYGLRLTRSCPALR